MNNNTDSKQQVDDDDGGDCSSEANKRKRSESTSSSTATSNDAASSEEAKATSSSADNAGGGSSLLFQPHRSLGMLTAATPSSSITKSVKKSYSPSSQQLFQSQKGKFHLQPQATSSDETFVTIPLGERFQIMTVSKLVPVLVSRALPPSADHHRHSRRPRQHNTTTTTAVNDGKHHYKGGDEEEMHQAISDSSLSITIVTHGPKIMGRAVSITMYSRTRPVVCLDAFPFLGNGDKKSSRDKNKKDRWGIVVVIQLGKQRVAMSGEKEGKMENALLFAIVCAKGDVSGDGSGCFANGKSVGNDSDDEDSEGSSDSEESEASASKVSTSDNDGSSDDDSSDDGSSSSMASLEDKDKAPAKDCYGRVLIVQATRTTLKIIKTIDLNGIGSNFIPYVGLHPATYVNKILLGGCPANAVHDTTGMDQNDVTDKKNKKLTSLLLLNVRSGKMIHSFQSLSKKNGRSKNHQSSQKKNDQQQPSMIITTLSQSPAVDTIAVGTSDGSVHLINTLHDVKLFTLQHKSKESHKMKMVSSNSNAVSSISFRTDGNATRQGVAPLAVGTDDGTVSVWDLTPIQDENDKSVVRRTLLTQIEGAHHGGISKLEYLPGEPLLLSTGLSSNSIVLHVFDAPDHSGRVLRQRKGHTSPPTLLRYLHPGLSGGGILANASDGTDASSCQILSCGGPGDLSLRLFSTARSNLDKEYSQGPGLDRKAKKLGMIGPEGRAELLLPEIAALATSEARSREWGDLVTIHRNHAMAYVWSTKRGAQSGPVLRQPQWNISAMKVRPPRSANATSLAISACGNFALVGTVGGVVYKYNLQSGLPRGSYPRDATSLTADEERRRRKGLKSAGDVGRTMRILEKHASKGGMMPSDVDQAERDRVNYLQAEAKRKAIIGRASHDGAVVGIAIDSLNKTVVTAGADSKLVLWNFATHMPHKKSPIMLPSPATKLIHVRDSDLAAIAMNDFGVAVFDCTSLTIVRYFGGSRYKQSSKDMRLSHTGPISDLNFGPDGRKLFTSSLDGTIRVWDVPTGLCVDWMSFSSPPTSLALSPTGEFLATSHVGRLGISLWCDKSFFRMVLLDGTPNEPSKMNEPCPVAECEQEGANDVASYAIPSMLAKNDELSFGDGMGDNELNDGLPPQAKEQGLITMSGLPPAHWKNLFHLELVKERNKPTEAPQKPPQAPFFLQWRSSGPESGTADAADKTILGDSSTSKDANSGWDAVWSDDDAEDNAEDDNNEANGIQSKGNPNEPTPPNKRRKV
ncbi:hypothetical protein ACHAXR_006047, partial [Thalassiosira sp. AJA248-18]